MRRVSSFTRFLITALSALAFCVVAWPALAREGHPSLRWRHLEDADGQALDPEALSGQEVQVRLELSLPKGVKGWSLEALPPDEAVHRGFGILCEDSLESPRESVEVVCEWDTTAYSDGGVSLNESYLLAVTAWGEGDDAKFTRADPYRGTPRRVALANQPSAPRGVALGHEPSSHTVALDWQPNPEPDVAEYLVEERLDSKPWVEMARLTTTSYERRLDQPGTYRYRVGARRRIAGSGATEVGPRSSPQADPREVVIEATTEEAPGDPDPAEAEPPPSAPGDKVASPPSQDASGGTASAVAPTPPESPSTEPEAPHPQDQEPEPVLLEDPSGADPSVEVGAAKPDAPPEPQILAPVASEPASGPAPVASSSEPAPARRTESEMDPGYSPWLPYRRPPGSIAMGVTGAGPSGATKRRTIAAGPSRRAGTRASTRSGAVGLAALVLALQLAHLARRSAPKRGGRRWLDGAT